MRSLVLPAVAVLGLFAFGCSPSSTGAGASPDGGAATTDGGAAGAKALTCSGILSCASTCNNDKACEDKCVAQGSPAAKESVNGLVACVDMHSCNDATCFNANCDTELQACIASSSSPGEALTGTAPAGSVPAELVGRWYSADEVYDFQADGTASFYTEVKTAGCTTTSLEKGTAVANGDSLTIYFTTRAKSVCNTPSSTPYTPKSVPFTFSVDPATATLKPILHLKELNCRYSDPAAADMFCRVGYDKE